MNFAITLSSPPDSATTQIALEFVRTTIDNGHHITRIFLQGDAVLNGDESHGKRLAHLWQELAQANIDLVLCSASVERIEAQNDLLGSSRLPGFSIGGYAQLVDASLSSNRLIQF